MKSKNRQRVADKAEERIRRIRERREEASTGQTGAEALTSMLGLEVVEPVKEKEPEQKIILYLREGLKGAEQNWTKYPNEMHDVMQEHFDKPAQSALYFFLWRQAWGFGKNYCRIGYAGIVKRTSIRSRWEAIEAVSKLKERKFIVQALKEDDEPNTTQSGTLYRILTPQEIISGITEEGVSLSTIPDSGIVCISIPDNNSADKQYTGIQDTGIVYTGILDNDTPDAKPDDIRDSAEGADIQYTVNQTRLKKKDKDSLSHIITGFYNSIGQKQISKGKRESAEKVIEDLLADGFSIEDIQFTAEWTPANAKEDLYDFSIIKHTIGQAMAVKADLEKAAAFRSANEEARQKEQANREAEETERDKFEAVKASLSDEERETLRQQAVDEIKASGEYKAAFITDALIEAKENEILRTK